MPALFPRGVGPSVSSIQPRLVYPRLSPSPSGAPTPSLPGLIGIAIFRGCPKAVQCPRSVDLEFRLRTSVPTRGMESVHGESALGGVDETSPSFPSTDAPSARISLTSTACQRVVGLILAAKVSLASGKVFNVNDLRTHLFSAPGPQSWKPSRLERP